MATIGVKNDMGLKEFYLSSRVTPMPGREGLVSIPSPLPGALVMDPFSNTGLWSVMMWGFNNLLSQPSAVLASTGCLSVSVSSVCSAKLIHPLMQQNPLPRIASPFTTCSPNSVPQGSANPLLLFHIFLGWRQTWLGSGSGLTPDSITLKWYLGDHHFW